MTTPMLATPQPVQLNKRASLTPSVNRFLERYPPAIIPDSPVATTSPQLPIPSVSLPPIQEPVQPRQLPQRPNTFARRFPHGYKLADVSIPLHPDEVPPGQEQYFSPTYVPICRRVTPICRVDADVDIFVGMSVSTGLGGWSWDTYMEASRCEFPD